MLECIFRGQPKPNITWKLGNRTLDNISEKLELPVLSIHDEGIYTCRGDNFYGSDEYNYSLIVNCK